MLLNASSHTAANPWGEAPSGPVIDATYRRGVLRARVSLSMLCCHGARIDTMETLKPGTLLWLTLPGLNAQAATVEWSEGFTAAIVFTVPLHPAVVDAVYGRAASRLN